MKVDRIEEVVFDGNFRDLIITAAIRNVSKAIKEGREPEYLEGDEFPWLDVKIHAVVGKRKQCFKCQFKISKEKESDAWGISLRCNHKGFSGKAFEALIEREIDSVAEAIFELVKISPSGGEETFSPFLNNHNPIIPALRG
jgi:hypothetical protein